MNRDMNLQKTTKQVAKILGTKQDPDSVTYTKSWDETGRLKGWNVECLWGSIRVLIDSTDGYCQVVGDLNSIPEFIKGKHQEVIN